MSSRTKIMVIKMREIIYTILFLVLIVLLLALLFLMFSPSSKGGQTESAKQQTTPSSTETDTAQYIAGVYTTPVRLGNSSVDVEVTVDENHINSIRLVNLSETATAMYPLVTPSLEELSRQICQKQSLENITCPEDNKYTTQLLLNAISQSLETARSTNWQ